MKARSRNRGGLAVALLGSASLLLGACTVMPTEPSVLALPGSSKSPGQYQVDVADCQQHAGSVIASSYQPQQAFDSAYLQCMYSRGNKVPMPQGHARRPSRPVYLDAPSASSAYPPPGTPPPPGISGVNAPGASQPGPATGYPPPANIPPANYPPPNAPPPTDLPPRS